MATWAITTTCRDVPAVVEAFVAHHLEAGAAEIHLFFDDPDDPSFERVAGLERVRAHRCDAAHWERRDGRPEDHRRRQTQNANQARRGSKAEWIGHIDIDEFVHAPGGLGTFLDTVPAAEDVVRLIPAERIFTEAPAHAGPVFEGAFKLPFRQRPRLREEFWGPKGRLFHGGFLGHAAGKVFVRTSARLHLSLHYARRGGERMPSFHAGPEARLLHYFPFGFDAWLEKFERRLDKPDYLARIGERDRAKFELLAAARARGDEAVWELFLDLFLFGPARIARLKRAGLLLEPEIDLPAAAARLFNAPVSQG